jgi:hypothetical protein
MRPLFDSATLIAFEIGRIARPYNIEILYGPFFGGHLERWLRARKLSLLTCVQTRDHLGRDCGVSIHNQPRIYDTGALKYPRHTSFSHAISPHGSFLAVLRKQSISFAGQAAAPPRSLMNSRRFM